MEINEEELLRRLTAEKNAVGQTAKWMALASAGYFLLMLFDDHPIGLMILAGTICLVSSMIWRKKRAIIKQYQRRLLQLIDESTR